MIKKGKDENPDERNVGVIVARRAWSRGEITDAELEIALYAAKCAARVVKMSREEDYNDKRRRPEES